MLVSRSNLLFEILTLVPVLTNKSFGLINVTFKAILLLNRFSIPIFFSLSRHYTVILTRIFNPIYALESA